MYQIILMFHVFAAICIVSLVLVQQGKGATMGAAFGSGASSTVFGSRGSGSFLFRITVGFICAFFITSIGLNYLAAHAFKQDRVLTLPMVPTKSPTKPTTTDTNVPASSTKAETPELPVRK